jgi:hypothetical protein
MGDRHGIDCRTVFPTMGLAVDSCINRQIVGQIIYYLTSGRRGARLHGTLATIAAPFSTYDDA